MPDEQCIESEVTYNKCDTSLDYQESMFEKEFVILSNQKRIVTDSYLEDSPIINESILSFYPLDLNSPASRQLHVKKTELEREDSLTMAIETITEIEEFGFETKVHDTRPYFQGHTI